MWEETTNVVVQMHFTKFEIDALIECNEQVFDA